MHWNLFQGNIKMRISDQSCKHLFKVYTKKYDYMQQQFPEKLIIKLNSPERFEADFFTKISSSKN